MCSRVFFENSIRLRNHTGKRGDGAGQDAEGTKTSTPHIPGLGPSSVAQVTNRHQ